MASTAKTYGALPHDGVDILSESIPAPARGPARKAAVASSLALLLVALVAGVSSWSRASGTEQLSATSTSNQGDSLAEASAAVTALAAQGSKRIEFTHYNQYTKGNTAPYPFLKWTNLAEPHRAHTFELTNSSLSALGCDVTLCEFTWKLGHTTYVSAKPVHKFTATGYQHVGLQVTEAATGTAVASTSDSVMVKYVRREIRDLTEDDRTTFLNALHTAYTVDTDAGAAKYGSDYLGIEYFVRKHLYGAASKECDHWHDDAGIMTHHVGFTLEFERNLQRVAPSTSIPYWEYTIDEFEYCSKSGGGTACWANTIARKSEMFKDSWFGEAIPNSDDFSLTKGRWAQLAVLQNARNFSTVTNPYGLLRSPWNTDPTPRVMRHNTVLGESWEQMVGCARWDSCFQSGTLSELNSCLNGGTHGPIHILLGGQWDNNHTILLERDSIFHGISGPHLLLAKHLWRYGYLRCPDTCSSDTPAEHCMCSCPDKTKQGASAYEILAEKTPVMHWLAAHARGAIEYVADEDRYHIVGYTRQMEDDTWEELLDALCDPGHVGEMYTSAAPYDPTFWVIHPTAERMMAWRRLLGDNDWKPFNESWGYSHHDDTSDLGRVCHWSEDEDLPTCEVGQCSGHGKNDLLPFEGLLVEGQRPSNAEVYAFIHPNNDDLPYAYDSFDYPQCAEQGIPIGWDMVPTEYKERR